MSFAYNYVTPSSPFLTIEECVAKEQAFSDYYLVCVALIDALSNVIDLQFPDRRIRVLRIQASELDGCCGPLGLSAWAISDLIEARPKRWLVQIDMIWHGPP